MLVSRPVACAELWDVMKSAEVDARFAKMQRPVEVVSKPNFAAVFRVSSGVTDWQMHPEADELWFVRSGSAKVSLGDAKPMAGMPGAATQQFDAATGDIVNVPRNNAYRIAPGGGRFEYVALRIFPSRRHLPLMGSGATSPKPMPTVVTKAQIDAALASAKKIENLHSSGAAIVNYIVSPPVWPKPSIPESHMACDDFYFIRLGTAHAMIDGYIVNPKEEPAGEIHGTSAVGARAYTVGPGDLAWIPRNTMHYMVPDSPRFGYLLVKVCE